MKANYSILIAAAGRGTRTGLSYPKTLYPIQGKPILLHLLDTLSDFKVPSTIVASPDGEAAIRKCLGDAGYDAPIVIQERPLGMGDAVLCFERSVFYQQSEHVLLVWGDIPFIQQQTVTALLQAHFEHANDLTLVSARVDAAYTCVERDGCGAVTGVFETRETPGLSIKPGERDVGLFVFRKTLILEYLKKNSPGKISHVTGEHGFLYIIKVLASHGYKIEALPIATSKDLVSLNHLDDVCDVA